MSTQAELLAERAELISKNEAATSWGAAVGARSERIKAIDSELRRLESAVPEPVRVAQGGNEPTQTKEDFAKWSRVWHDACETMVTLLGLPGGGSPQELLAQVQSYVSAAQCAPQPSDALGDELNVLFENYLNNPAASTRDRAETRLRSALWDNKAGIIARLRAQQPNGEPEVDEHLWGRFVNHYWDSLEGDKAIVLLHVRAVLDYHAANALPAGAVSCAAREAVQTEIDKWEHDRRTLYPDNEVIASLERVRVALSLPAAGGEASKHEAEIVERCAQVAVAMTQKWGDPNGNDYQQGAQDHGIRIIHQIRALASIPDDGQTGDARS
ncbi:hypothetical protein SAMN03159423_4811 [Bradyrhizobium sp. NFR13]|uniref:hypothetical protein n=1 Tax=Bradyrhizobium sp. NFR13 TaxID=1566285 RepID=UPI0008F31ED2|nr:hypothetical protein [Bradyrhizobium sp. NFR13]SFL99911.1 hypothetical protein SAMN03159423_4811 [Bradyrhizobium sp. NFR13]